MNSIFSIRHSKPEPAKEELEIALDGAVYPLRIRKLAQSRSIAVSADTVKREVRLTMPEYASTAQAVRFAQSKSDWLAAQFASALPPVPIVNGAQVALLGEPYRICWSPEFPRKPEIMGDQIQVGGPQEHIQKRILNWMKLQAKETYAVDLAFYCDRATSPLPELSVGDARRRWGSCSGRKAIRLSWRLIMAPPSVRRSVVAHEVAHLTHMNHSATFYSLLDSIFEGNRRAADRWLKRHGSALHLVGA